MSTRISVSFRGIQHLLRRWIPVCFTTMSHQLTFLNHSYIHVLLWYVAKQPMALLSIQVATGRCHHRCMVRAI